MRVKGLSTWDGGWERGKKSDRNHWKRRLLEILLVPMLYVG